MKKIKKKYFGTDGIRGHVGDSLVRPEFILKLGWAVGSLLANRKQYQSPAVLIGKDTRTSGYMIESALEAGLSAAGVNTKLIGPMPTPGIAYLTRSIRAAAGIVISASHNVYSDNGIKIFNAQGFKLSDKIEAAIEKKIDEEMCTVPPDQLGKAVRISDASGRYIEFCKGTFPNNLTLHGLKLVIDPAHGAAYQVAPAIFHELGANVIAISNKPNGLNINDGCGSTDTHLLQKTVLAEKADLGIAFDGDGDRVVMVDHQGRMVDGDELLCILAINRFSDCVRGQKQIPGGVVGTVMSNMGLEHALQRHHIAFERVAVGDRYVLEALYAKNWLLGGEPSGHIVDLACTTTGDGIITALQILSIILKSGKPLAELTKVMMKYPQIIVNVPIQNDLPDIRSMIHKHAKIKKVIKEVTHDLNGTGRIILRPSGTEPVVRVMVEGDNESLIHAAADKVVHVITEVMPLL